MNELIIPILSVIAMMGADRFRGAGGTFFIKCDWYASLFFGFIMYALLQDYSAWHILAFALAYKLGESIGWGSPLGQYLSDSTATDYEEWQVNKLLKKPHVALLVRGAMWGLPIAVVFYSMRLEQLAIIALISFTVSFLLAPFIAKKLNVDHKWAWQEELRGGLQMMPIAIACVM